MMRLPARLLAIEIPSDPERSVEADPASKSLSKSARQILARLFGFPWVNSGTISRRRSRVSSCSGRPKFGNAEFPPKTARPSARKRLPLGKKKTVRAQWRPCGRQRLSRSETPCGRHGHNRHQRFRYLILVGNDDLQFWYGQCHVRP